MRATIKPADSQPVTASASCSETILTTILKNLKSVIDKNFNPYFLQQKHLEDAKCFNNDKLFTLYIKIPFVLSLLLKYLYLNV